MCGGLARIVSDRKLRERYRIREATLLKDSYNIALPQLVAAVRVSAGERALVLLKWGLIPAWAKDATISHKSINARSELVSLAEESITTIPTPFPSSASLPDRPNHVRSCPHRCERVSIHEPTSKSEPAVTARRNTSPKTLPDSWSCASKQS